MKYNCSKISEAYLRTEVFGHIGFEVKQEMKPYNILYTKLFRWPFWERWDSFFQDGVTMWVIIQNTKCSDIYVAENQHK